MIKSFQVGLAQYMPIQEWEPEVGDIIIYHGWIVHWFGLINQIEPNGIVSVVRAGIPILLLTMGQSKMSKSISKIDSDEIKLSTGGKYAVVKNVRNATVWYV
jgi:hypothetical protein